MAFPFSKLASLLSELEDIECHDPPLLPKQRPLEFKARIESWFSSNRSAISRLDIKNSSALLWTLLPERNIDRVYGIQANSLCRILCRALGLSATGARDLEAYTLPGRGDLGSCLERVTNARGPPASPRVTLEDVDAMLERLAGMSAFSGPAVPRSFDSSADRAAILQKVFLRATALESKWIVRLILKDLSPVRLNDRVILRCFHFLFPDLLLFQNNVGKAVALLKGELKEFPCQPDSRSEVLHRQQAATLIKPCIGVKVGRPEFYKARSPKQCLEMVGQQKWVLERKYDGEYCEIHVQVRPNTLSHTWITIFSKGGKNSTLDRKELHPTLVECLRLGQPECRIKQKAILLGELVVCIGTDNVPLPFEKIRKHVSRSGRFLGTDADSQGDPDEHLAIVFFDLLLLDNEIMLRRSVEERRGRLREIYRKKPGSVQGAEWRVVDFAEPDAQEQLLTQFAASIARHCEGLVLKPCGVPYVTLGSRNQAHVDGYIKLKKDYMEGLGDEADLVIIGASYNAQRAAKLGLSGLRWTDFHLGCLLNKDDILRYEDTRPVYKVVDTISHSTCIPPTILQALNSAGQYPTSKFGVGRPHPLFDIENSKGRQIDVTFDTPIIVEVLGSEFVKPPNCGFFTLRHARMKKLHQDRSWKSTVSFQELQEQALISRALPEDSESQEIRRRVAELERKCARKFEREQTVSPRSNGNTSSASAGSAGFSQKSKSPLAASALDKSSAQSVSRKRSTLDSPCAGGTTINHSSSPETGKMSSRKNRISGNGPKKRPRIQGETLEKSSDPPRKSSPLVDITNIAVNERRQSDDRITPPPTSSTSSIDSGTSLRSSPESIPLLGRDTPPSSPPCPYAEIVACELSQCLFSKAVIYLTPCIALTPYIVQTLLGQHNVVIISSQKYWDRDSFAHEPLTATVSESQAYADMRKIVLVERNRKRALQQMKMEIERLNEGSFRERIEMWDWRVLEEELCGKHMLQRANAMKHFLGATVFDAGQRKATFVGVP